MPTPLRASLLILFALSIPGAVRASDVPTVIDQLIASYGGEESLRKMDNMIQEWDMVALMGNRHGTDTRSVRAPHQLRVDLSYPGKTETRILNGNDAHTIFNDGPPQVVSGIQKDAMRLQLMRLYTPLMLRDKIDSVSLVEQGGLLALSLVEDGLHVHYMVNRDNWRIEKVAGIVMINGNEIQFLTEYTDFAMIEGVLMHRSENKFANGMNTAKLKLRRVSFDTQADDDLFKP